MPDEVSHFCSRPSTFLSSFSAGNLCSSCYVDLACLSASRAYLSHNGAPSETRGCLPVLKIGGRPCIEPVSPIGIRPSRICILRFFRPLEGVNSTDGRACFRPEVLCPLIVFSGFFRSMASTVSQYPFFLAGGSGRQGRDCLEPCLRFPLRCSRTASLLYTLEKAKSPDPEATSFVFYGSHRTADLANPFSSATARRRPGGPPGFCEGAEGGRCGAARRSGDRKRGGASQDSAAARAAVRVQEVRARYINSVRDTKFAEL